MKNKYCNRCGIQIFWNYDECGYCVVIPERHRESETSTMYVFSQSHRKLFEKILNPKPDKDKTNYSYFSTVLINYRFLFRGYETINPLPGNPL